MGRPFWSIMIPTFNSTATLRSTIESVLSGMARDGATQIEVVDDCSNDSTEELVSSYRGYGLTFYRQSKNVGATSNFNTCIARAQGEWIHILHGDDYVHSEFYSTLRRGIAYHQRVRVAFTSFVAVDKSGATVWQTSRMPAARGVVDHSWRDIIAVTNTIMAPAIVVQKNAYAEAGGFNTKLHHAADWDMWKRLIWRYDAYFEPRVLAYYLVHSSSDSSRLMRSGENVFDALRAIKIGSDYFPIERRKELAREARTLIADFGLNSARGFLAVRDYRAAFMQLYASSNAAPWRVLGRELPKRVCRRIVRRRRVAPLSPDDAGRDQALSRLDEE